ncbi:MAG: hypothetical protein ACI8SK_000828 [Shewanella sp.]|jgi:hypothetical protein
MLSRPLYEILPLSYIAIGSASILWLDEKWALVAAFTVFYLGTKVYNMRSQNRRTDPSRKRKKGNFPLELYNALPFVYLFIAIIILKSSATGLGAIISVSLMLYSLYLLIKRSTYRRHKLPAHYSMF